MESYQETEVNEEIHKELCSVPENAPELSPCTTLVNEPMQQTEQTRELMETKLLKQLSEMAVLLEQQNMILQTQQKLLEDLTGRKKKVEKRKPGITKRIKSLIHKGKIIWSVL